MNTWGGRSVRSLAWRKNIPDARTKIKRSASVNAVVEDGRLTGEADAPWCVLPASVTYSDTAPSFLIRSVLTSTGTLHGGAPRFSISLISNPDEIVARHRETNYRRRELKQSGGCGEGTGESGQDEDYEGRCGLPTQKRLRGRADVRPGV
jgi:hypothetical protein